MATLGGTNLGDVQSEKQTKDSGLFNQPLPVSDSDETILLDIFGVTRIISIEGVFRGTLAEIRSFISTIEGYESGNQTGLAFISDLITSPASRTVFIQNFEWTYVAADTERITYNLVLIEGESVA
jgi:hypothetical protein